MTTPNTSRFSRNLSLLAFAPLALAALFVVIGQAMASTTTGNPMGVEGDRIILRSIDRHPSDAPAAKRTWSRIDAAALEVCGGGGFASRQVNDAIHRSDCWHSAMNGALAQIRSPLLPLALADGARFRP